MVWSKKSRDPDYYLGIFLKILRSTTLVQRFMAKD